jgi:hypothetical protein
MNMNHLKNSYRMASVVCLFFLNNLGLQAATHPVYGQDEGGGKVACLKSDGGIGNLIAARQDSSAGITWGGQGLAIGRTAQSETDGATNTQAIVATLGTSTCYAALLCSNYEVDSSGNSPCQAAATCYKDWFLPARKQLDCLRSHQKEIGGFANDFYWSSSEFAGYPQYSAWDTFFGEGEHPFASVNDFNKVRCVRVFNPLQ